MATYLVLFNWTDQGIRNVRDTVDRYDRATELGEKHGVRIEQIYWTVGPYDIAVVAEAPDDESVSAFLLELSSAGNLRTTTLRAYNREEMSSILERLASG
ncbi:MAG: GYD domain-containing protein [Actinomycetota bacterium]|nr:GYD domain-containing protein [Actinomycetota bacterium]